MKCRRFVALYEQCNHNHVDVNSFIAHLKMFDEIRVDLECDFNSIS